MAEHQKKETLHIKNVQLEDGVIVTNPLKIRSILRSDKILMWKAQDTKGKIWSNVELAGRKVKVEMMTVEVYDDSFEEPEDLEIEDRFYIPETEEAIESRV
jgi:hypothetical protein